MPFRALASICVLLALGAIAAPSASASDLRIPSIGLHRQTQSSLDMGPQIYWKDVDTVAIAGHRTTHGAPFLHLDKLKPGDVVRHGSRKFTVVRSQVVKWNATWVLRWKGLLLSACSRADGSPTSLEYRLVVFARPIGE